MEAKIDTTASNLRLVTVINLNVHVVDSNKNENSYSIYNFVLTLSLLALLLYLIYIIYF